MTRVEYQASEKVTNLENPIDVMYLIHKALFAEARRVLEMQQDQEQEDSLQPFRAAFNFWATALMYHADIEDRYMTAPLTDFKPARDNEVEHAELAKLMDDLESYVTSQIGGDSQRLEKRVKEAIIALHEQQHTELLEKLEDVLATLNKEIGKTRIVARTHRHLFGKVVSVLICQNDHLETEEAFVLPEVRQSLSPAQQLELAKHLLVDEEAADPNWILDWVAKALEPREQGLLKELQARFDSISTGAG